MLLSQISTSSTSEIAITRIEESSIRPTTDIAFGLDKVIVTNFPQFLLVQPTKSTYVSFCYFSYFNLINIPLSFPQTPCISFRGQCCHIYAERIEDIVRSWHAKRDSILYITYVYERRIDFPLSLKIQRFQM